MKIITLTTDFGTADPYVGAMKGVLYSMAPEVRIVDITHEIPPHDILHGQLALESVYSYFPQGTIHVAVVDPGVGTDQRGLLVQAAGHYFLGPDNGLFTFLQGTQFARAWALRGDLTQTRTGVTFDGRDLFAPAAAKLALGQDPGSFAKPTDNLKQFSLPEPTMEGLEVRGEVIAVDRFGNLITNIRKGVHGERGSVEAGSRNLDAMYETYGMAQKGDFLALWNSSDRLELAVCQGSAAEVLQIGKGAMVTFRRAK